MSGQWYSSGPRPGECLISEANGSLSRQQMPVAQHSQTYASGEVVSLVIGKAHHLAPAAADGTEAAGGVLYAAVDATAADGRGVVIDGLAEVRADQLVWPADINDEQKSTALAQLAERHIKAR